MSAYSSLFQRLMANCEPENDSENACWIWKGGTRANGAYPCFSRRVAPRPAKPKTFSAHRAVLEEVLDAVFPFDEAGHLCFNSLCVRPDHLEVQTPAFNLLERRGYAASARLLEQRMVPVLFPRSSTLEERVAKAFDSPGLPGDFCPF